jgi:acetyl-CoA carboxylase carboxyl transferase subunit alpha
MYSLKLIDGIIKEPIGGAHSIPTEIFDTVKGEILKSLKVLSALSPEERIKQRIDKFCAMGVYQE